MAFDFSVALKNIIKLVGKIIQFIDTIISQDYKYIKILFVLFCQKYLEYVFIMGD